eukprot:TRINITY_DN44762_c0_g1_i1.p1 TRINITY_DN44762_c0_g1~~TRINITY_DN44762_c0_g1_i1.p1  ORF type:complete len:203 (-),score=20.50 TRINITY_DN44762_c0_g1_i1:341-949(-)
MPRAVFVTIVALLAFSAVSASKCGKIPDCAGFNVSQYLGVWYEQTRSGKNLIFERDCHCVTANYTVDPSNPSNVVVSNGCTKSSNTGKSSIALGSATVESPCQLGVKFSPSPITAPYHILFTDYTTYTVVASCSALAHPFNLEDIWILSRKPTLPKAALANLLSRLDGLGFDYSDVYHTPQGDDCVGQGYPAKAMTLGRPTA